MTGVAGTTLASQKRIAEVTMKSTVQAPSAHGAAGMVPKSMSIAGPYAPAQASATSMDGYGKLIAEKLADRVPGA